MQPRQRTIVRGDRSPKDTAVQLAMQHISLQNLRTSLRGVP